MTFDEYQAKAITTNLKNDDPVLEILQQVLGLGDEAGEVQSIFKKWVRDKGSDFEKLDLQNIKKELGDILWYIAVVSHDLGISLNDIAVLNNIKLADRQARGTLAGSGDNR